MAPAFGREAAEVHAGLYLHLRDEYGLDVETKIERALRLADAEVEAAIAAREHYRAQVAQAMDGLDLVVTPTMRMVAPPTGIRGLALRDDVLDVTFPWHAVGAPAPAPPCGPGELGLPASVQLVGARGADATGARRRAADRARLA